MLPNAAREAAVRHLLSHLEDADALRANPLTAHYFSGVSRSHTPGEASPLARIYDAVLQAAQNLAGSARGQSAARQARHRAIVVRCDLGSDPHKRVAADLGLSLRHFYRERKLAHQRLGEILQTAIPQPELPVALDRCDFALSQARTFRDAGRIDDAIAIITALAGERPRAASKVDLIATASEWMIDAYRLDAAAASLAQAVSLTSSVAEEERVHLDARIDVVRAALHWARGETARSRELLVRGIETMRGGTGPNDRTSLSACVLALLRHASNEDDLGNLQTALAALVEAGELLAQLRPCPGDLHARYLALLGLLQAELYGDSPATGTTIGRALECTRADAFSGQTVLAIVAYSIHAEMNCGDPSGGLQMLYECLPFAEASCLPADLGTLYKRIAECEALHGEIGRAKTYAMQARTLFPSGSLGWIDAQCFEATADLAERNYAGAAEIAHSAVYRARHIDNHRRLGCALRLQAEAYAGLHRLPESNAAIDEAIALLEGHTHSRALSLAYRFRAWVSRQ